MILVDIVSSQTTYRTTHTGAAYLKKWAVLVIL